MPLLHVSASALLGRWIGIYGNVSMNHLARYDYAGGPEVSLGWTREEYGVFVPVLRGPLAFDVTYSLVFDRIEIGDMASGQGQSVLPSDYEMHSFGIDASLVWNRRTSIEARVASNSMGRDLESGYSVGFGYVYQMRDSLKLGVTLDYTGYSGQDSNGHYSDESAMLGTSLIYSR